MIISIFIFLWINCFAKEITEIELRKSILSHFPLIEEAQLKLKSSEGLVTSAQGEFDYKLKIKHRTHVEDRYDNEFTEVSLEKPIGYSGINLKAGHRVGNGLFAPYEGKYDTSTAGELFAGLSLSVLKNRTIDGPRFEREFSFLNKKIAEKEVLIKKNLYLHKGLSIFSKWRLAYLTYSTRKELVQIAEERQLMIQKRLKAGDVERIKLLDNQRSLLKRKSELLDSELELKRLAFQISVYFRDEKGEMVDLSNDRPEVRIQNTFHFPSALSIKNLPQLEILDIELEKNKRLNDLNENEKLPTLDLEAIASRELSSSYPYDPQRVHVGVFFQYPLENRKARGKSVSSLYKGKALEKQRQWQEAEITNLYKQVQEVGVIVLKQIQMISQELANSKILADAERKRWTRGDSDLFIVAMREQDAADVEIKLWKVQYKLTQARLDAQLYSASLLQE